MAQELLYTSAPRGLKPGSRGFCTVLATQGMPAPLASAVEALSGYRAIYPPSDERAARNPVVYSHLKMQATGRSWHVLSRIADYGLDYSQRPNKLAHHVILDDPAEQLPGGPANLLLTSGFLRESWEGDPTLVAPKPITREQRPHTGVCEQWKEITGDAGWAGVVAESFLKDPDRQVILLLEPGQNILPLIAEAISLLPQEKRWDVTFSTYFTGLATGTTCNWRGILHGSKEATESLRNIAALRIDLASTSWEVAQGDTIVSTARTGSIERPSSIDTHHDPENATTFSTQIAPPSHNTTSQAGFVSQRIIAAPPAISSDRKSPPTRHPQYHRTETIHSTAGQPHSFKYLLQRHKLIGGISFFALVVMIIFTTISMKRSLMKPPPQELESDAGRSTAPTFVADDVNSAAIPTTNESGPSAENHNDSTQEFVPSIAQDTTATLVPTEPTKDEHSEPPPEESQSATASLPLHSLPGSNHTKTLQIVTSFSDIPIGDNSLHLFECKEPPDQPPLEIHLFTPPWIQLNLSDMLEIETEHIRKRKYGINLPTSAPSKIASLEERTERSMKSVIYSLKDIDIHAAHSLAWCRLELTRDNNSVAEVILGKLPLEISSEKRRLQQGNSELKWNLPSSLPQRSHPKVTFTLHRISFAREETSFSTPGNFPLSGTKWEFACEPLYSQANELLELNTTPSDKNCPKIAIEIASNHIILKLLHSDAFKKEITTAFNSSFKDKFQSAISHLLTTETADITKDIHKSVNSLVARAKLQMDKDLSSSVLPEVEKIIKDLLTRLDSAIKSPETDADQKQSYERLAMQLVQDLRTCRGPDDLKKFKDSLDSIRITGIDVRFTVTDVADTTNIRNTTLLSFDEANAGESTARNEAYK